MPPTREAYNFQPNEYGYGPELVFAVQPAKEHRFRYVKEFNKGSHGQLKGRAGCGLNKPNKAVPVVHLRNYAGSDAVTLKITLYTADGTHPHIHKLVEGSQEIERQPGQVVRSSDKRLEDGTLEYKIANVCICKAFKPELDGFLAEILAPHAITAERKKEIDNACVLFVEALDKDGKLVCQPIISEKIIHSQGNSNGKLNICHISKVAGFVTGGEEVFILCKKLLKTMVDVLTVEFFARDDKGNIYWRENARVTAIHELCAIIFTTPVYDFKIKKEVEVWMQLKYKDKYSDARQFTYRPTDDEHLSRKRKKVEEMDTTQYESFLPSMETINSAMDSSVDMFQKPLASSISQPQSHHTVQEASGEYVPDVEGYEENSPFKNMIDKTRDPMLSQSEEEKVQHQMFMFEEGYFIDSKSNGSAPAESEENIVLAQAQMSETRDSDADTKAPQQQEAGPQVNGDSAASHPDKLLAYKLALHTAQCLHNFAKTGDVRILLMSMRHLVALQDEQGDNAIHAAVIHSQSEAMKNLVEVARTVANYDILNMCNGLKESPLHIAVQTGQANAIKLLLYHGANPNLKDKRGNTPIHLAAQLKNADSLSALLETNAYITKYKKHEPDLNALNFSGFSALHLAVQTGSLSTVERLCYAGCDVDVRDRTSGRTALHIAVERHNLEIIGFLLHQSGAETDIHMFNGNTPLHLACSQNHSDTVDLLMQAKADPYLENYEKAENNEDDSDSIGSASLEDEDVRGLTSIDLATTEEIRSLLRGEKPLSSMSEKFLYEEDVAAAAPLEVAYVKSDPDKAEKKNNIMDSGIGLSGMGLSSTSLQDSSINLDSSNSPETLTLHDILDQTTKDRLAEILDAPPAYYWRKVLDFLNMIPLEKMLENHKSPTEGMLHHIVEIEILENVLEALALDDAKRVLHNAKNRLAAQKSEAYLDSKMQKMKL